MGEPQPGPLPAPGPPPSPARADVWLQPKGGGPAAGRRAGGRASSSWRPAGGGGGPRGRGTGGGRAPRLARRGAAVGLGPAVLRRPPRPPHCGPGLAQALRRPRAAQLCGACSRLAAPPEPVEPAGVWRFRGTGQLPGSSGKIGWGADDHPPGRRPDLPRQPRLLLRAEGAELVLLKQNHPGSQGGRGAGAGQAQRGTVTGGPCVPSGRSFARSCRPAAAGVGPSKAKDPVAESLS